MPFFAWSHPFSLQKKLVITLILVAVGFILAQLLVVNLFLYPSYLSLERDKGKTDMERCFNALGSETHHLDTFTNDWSSWDDSYQFMADGNKEYSLSNLQASTFVDNELFLIFYISREGEVIWGEVLDPESGEFMESEDFPRDKWPLDHPLLTAGRDGIHGLFLSSHGPLLVASRSIFRSDHSGTSRGVLIMGRLLNEDLIATLRKQTQVKWTVSPVTASSHTSLPEKSQESIQFRQQEDALMVTSFYPDLLGQPALLLRAEVDRDISRQGIKTLSVAFLGSAFGVVVIFTLLLKLLNRMIVRPVTQLTSHVVKIHKSGNLALLARGRSEDEIGVLTREINHLTQKLFSHQQQLQALSARLLESEETERRKFAIDLHDRIGQSLTIVKIRLDGMAADPEVQGTEAAALSTILEQLIQETRTLTFELSPPMLYEIGLCAALEWLLDSFREHHSLPVRYSCSEIPKEKNPSRAIMAFQIIRELLMNIVKHASATEVELSIAMKGEILDVSIQDNGVGLPADFDLQGGGNGRGFGLFSIHQRLSSFEGSLELVSSPGQGTHIHFGIPSDPVITGNENWEAE